MSEAEPVLRRLITLMFAGCLPPDLASSRSGLFLSLYVSSTFLQRHWLSTAKKCKFPGNEMSQIMDRIVGDMDSVIDTVGNNLPENFPENVAAPIFDGMKSAKCIID